jgi:adenylate cyclase
MEIRYVRGGFDEGDKAKGVRHARVALARGGDDAAALAVASLVILLLDKDAVAATSGIGRAIALNGSSALACLHGALIHGWAGDKALAEEYANRALRLSPFDPHGFQAHHRLSSCFSTGLNQ